MAHDGLGLLLVITFLPLFSGQSFMTFRRNPGWVSGMLESSGQKFDPDMAYLLRRQGSPFAQTNECSDLAFSYPLDYYAGRRFRGGGFPLWKCRVPGARDGKGISGTRQNGTNLSER